MSQWRCTFRDCDKTFTEARNLRRHQLLHTDQAHRFACSVAGCERRFARRSDCLAHERQHNGEKPFRCETCCKCFARRSDLHAHELRHTKDFDCRFPCSLCEAKFARRCDLMAHMNRLRVHRNVNTSRTVANVNAAAADASGGAATWSSTTTTTTTSTTSTTTTTTTNNNALNFQQEITDATAAQPAIDLMMLSEDLFANNLAPAEAGFGMNEPSSNNNNNNNNNDNNNNQYESITYFQGIPTTTINPYLQRSSPLRDGRVPDHDQSQVFSKGTVQDSGPQCHRHCNQEQEWPMHSQDDHQRQQPQVCMMQSSLTNDVIPTVPLLSAIYGDLCDCDALPDSDNVINEQQQQQQQQQHHLHQQYQFQYQLSQAEQRQRQSLHYQQPFHPQIEWEDSFGAGGDQLEGALNSLEAVPITIIDNNVLRRLPCEKAPQRSSPKFSTSPPPISKITTTNIAATGGALPLQQYQVEGGVIFDVKPATAVMSSKKSERQYCRWLTKLEHAFLLSQNSTVSA